MSLNVSQSPHSSLSLSPGDLAQTAGRLAVALVVLLGLSVSMGHAQTVWPLQSNNLDSEGDFGISVDRVGDVDGDGDSEVIVGAEEEDMNYDGDGSVHIYQGTGISVSSFGSPNPTINGNFGGSVSYAGDLGGDAAPDVLVGASNEDTDGINRAGAAYAFTHTGTRIRTFKSPNIEDDGSFGGSVNSIADLTGDGTREVLIGAPRETVSSGGTDYDRAGRLYVMNGATGSTIHTLSSQNPETGGNFGVSADAIGDVDGDSAPDIVVGAKDEDVNGSGGAGRAYVFSGATGAHLYTLTSTDVQRTGSFGGGDSVAGVGDINGDGMPDLAVAAGGEDGGEDSSGNVYLFSGDGSLLYAMRSPTPTFLGNFGTAVDGMPDVNDDGHDDFVVGAKSEGTSGDNAGLVYLFSGNDGTVIKTLRSGDPEDGGKFGADVAYAGDVEGDNIPDVVSGALEESVGGTGDAGSAYVHTGFYFFLGAESIQTVASDGLVDFGATGVDVNFSGVTQSGDVYAYRLTDAPRNVSGISEGTVSDYRVALDSFAEFGKNTEVRFSVSAFGGISDPNKVTVYKRADVGSGSFASTTKTIDENGTPDDISDDEIVVTTGSFSEFVFASNSEALPVELANFDARLSGDDTVRLRWTTASEQNNAGFRIERARADATGAPGKWTEVGSVEGAGTTTNPQSYQFTDNLPYAADRLTYRLKQIDTDGTTSLSDPVTVERRAVDQVQLLGTYPNPARQQATVRFALPEGVANTDVTMKLYDVLGRQVRTLPLDANAGRHQHQVDVRGLPSGLYMLRLSTRDAVTTQRFTVVQ
jgi:hypothetical protein